MILTSYVAGRYFPRYYTYCVDCNEHLGPFLTKKNVRSRCFDCDVADRAKKLRAKKRGGKT